MKILIYTLLILFVSCLKLDDIAFQGKELNSYELDNYTGSKTIDNIPEEFAISSDKITFITTESKLQSEDNSKTIYSVYIGDISQISQDTIIIYCHGQSDHIDHYWPRAKLLANTGGKNRFGVIMMDYRGFGMSEGQSTEATMYEDVSSVISWLVNQGVTKDKMIIYGYSLGSIPATQMALENKGNEPFKLVLESAIASVAHITEESTIINVSPTFITSLVFDNAEKIKSIHQPLLLFHGTSDDYLSVSNGDLIYANYQGEYIKYNRVEGAFHGRNGVPQTMGYHNYLNEILSFIVQ